MKICLNSRDLTDAQRRRIEQYFHDNFNFDGKGPRLSWKEDESDYILLGFPHGSPGQMTLERIPKEQRRAPVVMFRVHERELMRIAKRRVLDAVN